MTSSCKVKTCIAITRAGGQCSKCIVDPKKALCGTHKKFVSYSPRWISLVLYDQLRVIKDVFERERIPFWLSFGTLLGAVRHQGLIPWDDDADINVDKKYMKRVQGLKTKFEDLGFCLEWDMKDHPQNFQLTNIFLPDEYTDSPGTDIFFYTRKKVKDKFKYVYPDNDFPDQDDPTPIRMVTFGNFKLPIPSEEVTEQQLNVSYPNWETTIVIDQWHLNSMTQRPQKRLNLSRKFAEVEMLRVEGDEYTRGDNARTPKPSQWYVKE